MDALSTTTYVQMKRLLYGGPGAMDLEDARTRAGEAVDALQDTLVRRPEEAEVLMRVSCDFKREMSEGLRSVETLPDTDDVARHMALGVATTAIMLGTIDGVLWEITGRRPMSVHAEEPATGGLADDLDHLRFAATARDSRVLARTCVNVARALPDMLSRGVEARVHGGFVDVLRSTAAHAWFAGFGDVRLCLGSQAGLRQDVA